MRSEEGDEDDNPEPYDKYAFNNSDFNRVDVLCLAELVAEKAVKVRTEPHFLASLIPPPTPTYALMLTDMLFSALDFGFPWQMSSSFGDLRQGHLRTQLYRGLSVASRAQQSDLCCSSSG